MPRLPVQAPSGERPAVALDNGSGQLKIGFAGEEEPRGVLPTSGLAEAGSARPIVGGIIKDWEAMETYWDHAFTNIMGVDTEHCNVITTAHIFETKDNRERIVQSLFESFAVPGVFLSSPPAFELYASGRENGVVVGCGAQCSYAVLIHEGLPDPRTQQRSSTAGDALTAFAAKALKPDSGAALTSEQARAAKEALGVAGLPPSGDADADAAAATAPREFKLPDGRVLKASAPQRESLVEPLFAPSLVGEAGGGLAQLAAECIKSRDRDGVLESSQVGRDGTSAWYGSIVLAGGSSMFPRLGERLSRDLRLHAPAGVAVDVCAPDERGHGAWFGASILGSLAVRARTQTAVAVHQAARPLPADIPAGVHQTPPRAGDGADVDLQGGVRREWAAHCPSQVLLSRHRAGAVWLVTPMRASDRALPSIWMVGC